MPRGPERSRFYAVAADDSGNLYAAAVAYDAGAGTDGSSVALVKYDSSGTVRCTRSVPEGSTGSAFSAIAMDGEGSHTVAGARSGAATCTFGPGVMVAGAKGSASAALLVKYRFDSTPTVKTPVIDLPGGTYTHDIALTITCATSGAVISYTENGAEPDATAPVYDGPVWLQGDGKKVFIKAVAIMEGLNASATAGARYEVSYASAQWARSAAAGQERSRFNAVAVGTSAVYAAGFTGANAALAAFDGSGNALWTQSVAAGPAESSFQGIVTDQEGNAYAAGYITGTGTYELGEGVTASGTSEGSNMVLVKYAPYGSALWARSVAGGGGSRLDGIAIDSKEDL